MEETIANTQARLAAANTQRRDQAYTNYMKARASPKPNSIANTIAKTKARLAKEETNNRERRAKASQKWLGTQARLNKAAANADHPDCESQGLVTFSETKVVPSRWQNGVEKRLIDRCVTPEELSRLEAAKQAKLAALASPASSPASSRSSSPVASSVSSPVYSNGSTSPTLSVKERMKLFQKGGDAMANWTARLAAERRINQTRRAGITPIRIPNVKFNTSSPSTPNTSSPSTPTSPMSVKNRIKFFENRRKSVGGKTRKNKNRKSKTKKSRRN